MWDYQGAFDPLGNVADAVTGGGVRSDANYDAYGYPVGSGGVAGPYGYKGQWGCYTDSESGLVLMGHRFYDTVTGRFLTRDPMGYSGGINLYAYCRNNPVNLMDPSGFCPDNGDNDGTDQDPLIRRYVDGTADWSRRVKKAAPVLWDGINGMNGCADAVGGMAAGALGGGGGSGEGFGGGEGGEGGSAGGGGDGFGSGEGGGPCFVAGAPVPMADGSAKVIEQVKAGDHVASKDAKTGELKAGKVVRTFRHTAPSTLTLTFSTGEAVTCTEGHPFYVEGKGFVAAGKLGIGTSIVTRAGPSVDVVGVEKHNAAAIVYNFEVEETHTYFVGKTGAWVHNDCTDVAKSLRDQYPEGDVWRLSPKDPDPRLGIAPKNPLGDWDPNKNYYHDVWHDGTSIRDPMVMGHSDPVSFTDWWNSWMYNDDGFASPYKFEPSPAR